MNNPQNPQVNYPQGNYSPNPQPMGSQPANPSAATPDNPGQFPTPTPPPRKSRGLQITLIVIIILLILALFVAGGVLGYRYWFAPKPDSGQAEQKQTESPCADPDDCQHKDGGNVIDNGNNSASALQNKDFLRNYDFRNSWIPAEMTMGDDQDDPCFEYWKHDDLKFEKVPDAGAMCWLKLHNGISETTGSFMGNPNSPLLSLPDANDPQGWTWDDFNGDGYTDVMIRAEHPGALAYVLAIANPKDTKHPYMVFFHGTQSESLKYLGSGKWEEMDPTGVYTMQTHIENKDDGPHLIRVH